MDLRDRETDFQSTASFSICLQWCQKLNLGLSRGWQGSGCFSYLYLSRKLEAGVRVMNPGTLMGDVGILTTKSTKPNTCIFLSYPSPSLTTALGGLSLSTPEVGA